MRAKVLIILAFVGSLSSCHWASATGNSARAQTSSPNHLDNVLVELRTAPDWLFPADDCPADIMPDFERPIYYTSEKCTADYLSCLDLCRSGNANDCYALALAIEALETDRVAYQALFLRACRLGIPSGCTNRASQMTYPVVESEHAYECAARTYKMTCAKNDPWGCTMYGMSLERGEGTPRDRDLALKYLERSCEINEEFVACKYARKLIRRIENSSPPASP